MLTHDISRFLNTISFSIMQVIKIPISLYSTTPIILLSPPFAFVTTICPDMTENKSDRIFMMLLFPSSPKAPEAARSGASGRRASVRMGPERSEGWVPRQRYPGGRRSRPHLTRRRGSGVGENVSRPLMPFLFLRE